VAVVPLLLLELVLELLLQTQVCPELTRAKQRETEKRAGS